MDNMRIQVCLYYTDTSGDSIANITRMYRPYKGEYVMVDGMILEITEIHHRCGSDILDIYLSNFK